MLIAICHSAVPLVGHGWVPLVFFGDKPFMGVRLYPTGSIDTKHALPTRELAMARALIERHVIGLSYGQTPGVA